MNPLHHGVVDTFGLVDACNSAHRTTLAQRNRHRLFEKPVEKPRVTDHGEYRIPRDELPVNIPGLTIRLERPLLTERPCLTANRHQGMIDVRP